VSIAAQVEAALLGGGLLSCALLQRTPPSTNDLKR
jgi:hypothetical protein